MGSSPVTLLYKQIRERPYGPRLVRVTTREMEERAAFVNCTLLLTKLLSSPHPKNSPRGVSDKEGLM